MDNSTAPHMAAAADAAAQTTVPAVPDESAAGAHVPPAVPGAEGGRNDRALRAILNMLGLAARSRRIVIGADAVIAAVRSKAKPHIVAVASDASERSRKQLADKCAFHGVALITLEATRAELAAAVGKKNAQCSACAVTDRNMAKKIDILYHG